MTEMTGIAALDRYETIVIGATVSVIHGRSIRVGNGNIFRCRDGHSVFDCARKVRLVRQGDLRAMAHTEVPRTIGGRSIGSLLATTVPEVVRGRGLRIAPEGEFIAAFVKRHPEGADLIVAPDNAP